MREGPQVRAQIEGTDSSEVGAHFEGHHPRSMWESAKLKAQFGGAGPFKQHVTQEARDGADNISQKARGGAQALKV